MRSYFLWFLTDQDVPPEMLGCVPEPVCLWPDCLLCQLYFKVKPCSQEIQLGSLWYFKGPNNNCTFSKWCHIGISKQKLLDFSPWFTVAKDNQFSFRWNQTADLPQQLKGDYWAGLKWRLHKFLVPKVSTVALVVWERMYTVVVFSVFFFHVKMWRLFGWISWDGPFVTHTPMRTKKT